MWASLSAAMALILSASPSRVSDRCRNAEFRPQDVPKPVSTASVPEFEGVATLNQLYLTQLRDGKRFHN